MDFSTIQNIDFQVLQWFNGSNNVILDQLAVVLTSGVHGYHSMWYCLSS